MKKEIKEINKSILITTICNIVLFVFIFIQLINDSKRLDEHKKAIIELTNKHNATINYLKAKEIYERNK